MAGQNKQKYKVMISVTTDGYKSISISIYGLQVKNFTQRETFTGCNYMAVGEMEHWRNTCSRLGEAI